MSRIYLTLFNMSGGRNGSANAFLRKNNMVAHFRSRYNHNPSALFLVSRHGAHNNASSSSSSSSSSDSTSNKQTSNSTLQSSSSPTMGSPTEDYFYNYRQRQRTGVFPGDLSMKKLNKFNPDDTRVIFQSFSMPQLLNSAFLFQLCSYSSLMNYFINYQKSAFSKLDSLKKKNPKTFQAQADKMTKRNPILYTMKRWYFPLFTGGETIQDCVTNSEIFRQSGVRLAIDLSTEETNNPAQWETNTHDKIELVKSLNQYFKNSVRFLPIKLTCLTSSDLFQKLNDILRKSMHPQIPIPQIDDKTVLSMLNENELKLYEDCLNRLRKIISAANEYDLGIWLDAEVYHKQPAINLFARQLMQEFNVKNKVVVYNTYQMYLKDAYYWLLHDLETVQAHGASMGIKLVRGAYMEYEKAYSTVNNTPFPIWPTKAETDRNYDKGIVLAMNQIALYRNKHKDVHNVGVALCTHNRASLLKALHLMDDRQIPKNYPDVNFAQLKGMADNLTFGLKHAGYNACKLVPYGPFEEVWPYLMRRIQENQDILNATATERKLYAKELLRRLIPL